MEILLYLTIAIIAIGVLIYTFVRGTRILKQFETVDKKDIVYSRKWISGTIDKSGRSSDVDLHLILTRNELITTSTALDALDAKKTGLLNRIPLKRISDVELRSYFSSGKHPLLVVCYRNENNEETELILSSRKNKQIKKVLDKLLRQNSEN